jgi:uncharacterized membrane protein YjjP (DUF1212 family)
MSSVDLAAPDEPAVDAARELRSFLVGLGSAMTAAGDSVDDVELHLQRVAAAYGAADATITVLPTFLVLALGPGDTTSIERTRSSDGATRLDQTAALFELVKQAERRDFEPGEGLGRLATIARSTPRFGWVVTLVGRVVRTVGVCLILQPTWRDLLVAAGFGGFVGVLSLTLARWPTAEMILPVLAAFAVSALTFVLAARGWIEIDLRAMIAPLVTFLPGAALTMAVVELTAGETVAGSSRLVAGSAQLVLLAFGIVAGARVVERAASRDLVNVPQNLLGAWAPWVGVLVFGVGTFVVSSAPPGSLRWLLVVLYAAWLGQIAGNVVFGGQLSGFFGALLMTPVAYAVAARPTGPPVLVTLLPAFWLLVPGALGLIGVTESIGGRPAAGLASFVGALGAIVAIALGVLCGSAFYRSVQATERRLHRVMVPLA